MSSSPGSPVCASSPKTSKALRNRGPIKRLKLHHINFGSIWSKKDELAATLDENNLDIVIGTETHLTPSIQSGEFLPDNYSAIRRDRGDGFGGVIVIYKSDLVVSELTSARDCEFLSVKVQCHGRKSIILAGTYRRPSGNLAEIENISKHIGQTTKKYARTPIWIAGDLNLPDIDWSDYSEVISM